MWRSSVSTLSSVRTNSRVVSRLSRLLPAVPNPFNPTTRLLIEKAPGRVELGVYDVRGRRVAELWGGAQLEPGRYAVDWHGLDTQGPRVASGICYARLRLDGRAVAESQKLVLIK